jgi:hypothetical protein
VSADVTLPWFGGWFGAGFLWVGDGWRFGRLWVGVGKGDLGWSWMRWMGWVGFTGGRLG